MAVYSRPLSGWSRSKAAATAAPRPQRANLLVTLAVVAALMSLLYLVQVGRVSTQGYQLEQLSYKRTQLERTNQQLMYEIEQAQSLDAVRQRALALGMQPIRPDQTRYLTIKIHPDSRWTAEAR